MIGPSHTDDGIVPFGGIAQVSVLVSGIADITTEADHAGAADIPQAVINRQGNGRTGFPETAQCGSQPDTGIEGGGSNLKLLRLRSEGNNNCHEGKDCFFHCFCYLLK